MTLLVPNKSFQSSLHRTVTVPEFTVHLSDRVIPYVTIPYNRTLYRTLDWHITGVCMQVCVHACGHTETK